MLLRITYTPDAGTAADDLGFLLHKHPGKVQTFDQPYGRAHVFYPRVEASICTACLLLEVDPVALVRGRLGSREGGPLEQYVNDRPYAATSLLAVALGDVFGTALTGRSPSRQALSDAPLALEAELPAVPVPRGGPGLARALFEPLGYEVQADELVADELHPEWGARHVRLRLRGRVRLRDLLAHLYVLVPALDDQKHYYVGPDEVRKLLARGAGWLADHPERATISARYLRHRRSLTRDALARLAGEAAPSDDVTEPSDVDTRREQRDAEEEQVERPLSLHAARHEAVVAALLGAGARRVLDLGCSDGKLLRRLLKERQFAEVVGVDVSIASLERAERRLRVERMPEAQRARLRLMHGSLLYRDARLAGFDAAALVEVIEHFDPERLPAVERVVFEFARPATVVVTTPNVEYNVRFPTLPAGKLRHRDHRFEWTRGAFAAWAEGVGERHAYTVTVSPLGPVDEEVGAPSQLAVFTRAGGAA